jgi:CRISPR-associated protein Cas5h
MTTTELDVVGRECLSVTVRGPWGHFRRVESTTGKQTYRVIPRTTVAGLFAAILGLPRDSYYETFARNASAVAISPQSRLETMQIPILTLPTEEGDIKTAEGVSGKTVVDPEVIAEERKRRTFEYVVDPSYRIDLILEDTATFERLRECLREGRSTYTPCLGKTECLASLEDVAVSTVEEATDAEAVESIVPGTHVVPTPGEPLRMERTPAYMTADETGRHTTGFVSYAYAPADETVTVGDAPTVAVDGRPVWFL